MNVSLTDPMEQFVRQKVAVGEYETASEVVREALRLLRHRDEVWRSEVAGKIKSGMDSIRTGRTLSSEKAQTEMAAFKKKWSKIRAAK
jgi:antitoxin ParD1/3/4